MTIKLPSQPIMLDVRAIHNTPAVAPCIVACVFSMFHFVSSSAISSRLQFLHDAFCDVCVAASSPKPMSTAICFATSGLSRSGKLNMTSPVERFLQSASPDAFWSRKNSETGWNPLLPIHLALDGRNLCPHREGLDTLGPSAQISLWTHWPRSMMVRGGASGSGDGIVQTMK